MTEPDPQATAPGAPPPPTAAFLILTVGRRLRDDADHELAAHGLTLRHLSALGHLGREPGLSYSELARRAGVTAQSMQATLRQLEAAGAVERRTPPGRGRTAELHPTSVGTRLRDAGRTAMDDINRQLLAPLSDEDAATLCDLLLRVGAVAPPAGVGRPASTIGGLA